MLGDGKLSWPPSSTIRFDSPPVIYSGSPPLRTVDQYIATVVVERHKRCRTVVDSRRAVLIMVLFAHVTNTLSEIGRASSYLCMLTALI